jgi:CRP-like cAMP-binding protein
VNHESHVPSDEELHHRLNSFIEAEIAADEEAADEATVRRELAQITGDYRYPQARRLPKPQPAVEQLARYLVRQAEQYAAATPAGQVATQSRAPARFWDGLDEIERKTLRRSARPRTYGSGAILCRQDDPSDHVIIIESGWAKVTSTDDDGRETILAIRGPGDVVGESAALGRRPRSATVTALATVQALLVPIGRLTTFLDEHPRAWRMLSGEFVRRIDDADRRLSAHTAAGGVVRLAILLLFLAEHYGAPGPAGSVVIRPPLSQWELASWVRTSRATVARAFKIWREERLVDAARRKIIVLSPVRLRAFVEDRLTAQDRASLRSGTADRGDRDFGEPDYAAGGPGSDRRSQHCVLFAVDIAGFTDSRRDDGVQLAVRKALYRVLRQAFNAAEMPWEECHREDRGDGVLVVIPAKMPSSTVVHPLLVLIRAGLRHHNRLSSQAAAIRLRVAVHIGEVHADDHGVAGSAVNHLFRLLDAPALKRTLDHPGAEIALIVSEYFFDSVIRHGPAWIDPDAFRPVTVRSKGSPVRGWINLPDIPPPAWCGRDIEAEANERGGDQRDIDNSRRQPPDRQEDFPPPRAVFTGPVTIYGDAVGQNKFVYEKDGEEP